MHVVTKEIVTKQAFNIQFVEHLVMLTTEKSHRMPSGLTREQRRTWAKQNQQTVLQEL